MNSETDEAALWDKLVALREQIKTDYVVTATNKPPRMPGDEALRLLVHYKPKSLSQLQSIRGIGEFVTSEFGQMFVDEIRKYDHDDTDQYEFSDDDVKQLEKLEERLINIDARNRLLYAPKINKDFGLDLVKTLGIDKCIEMEKLLVARSKRKLLTVSISLEDDSLFRQFLTVKKSADKLEVETGNNELYIGYPFVMGKAESGTFAFKAPLMLFPVKLTRDATALTLTNDFDRDVLYNSTLILANNKVNNGKNQELPDNEVDELDPETFIEQMIAYYKDNGIYLQNNGDAMGEFLVTTKKTFPDYAKGMLEIKKWLVLGLYSSYVSSMYGDFKKMIEEKIGTQLIEDLLWSAPEDNAEWLSDEKAEKNKKDTIEKQIMYINDLDSSQEEVLRLSKKQKALIVQGPPGTGKSQTITSLVAQTVLDGHNVLMVSEKKTALDVIYSRLGHLSNYAILIDDVNDKAEFYEQITKVVDAVNHDQTSTVESIQDLQELVQQKTENIDNQLEKLETISKSIYAINDFGASIYQLYTVCQKPNLRHQRDRQLYEYMSQTLPEYLKTFKFGDVEDCYHYSAEAATAKKLSRYHELDKSFALFPIKKNLRDDDLITLEEIVNTWRESREVAASANVFARSWKQYQANKILRAEIPNYFTVNTGKQIALLLEKIWEQDGHFATIIENYNEYMSLSYIYDDLSAKRTEYIDKVFATMDDVNIDFSTANLLLRNYIYYTQISNFEKENPEVLQYMEHFESITKDIAKNVDLKKEITIQLTQKVLENRAKNLARNGRLNKINEDITKKRRLSLKRFLEKYEPELMSAVRIWLMTPEVVSDILPFQQKLFDYVIFDEASQLYLEKSIPAIYRAKKIIIAGDKHQLKPSSFGVGRIADPIDEDEDVETSASEFESLLDATESKFPQTTLLYHYRSSFKELIEFSNAAFYKNKLLVVTATNTHDQKPIERLVLTDGQYLHRRNQKEAERVVQLIKQILRTRERNETIGVITFSSAQMKMIEDTLELERSQDSEFNTQLLAEESRTENGEDHSLFVKNIEQVQGDERDIIVFSIGYGPNEAGRVAIQFGWLSQDGGENRLNVAISRAKKKIYIVTSMEPEALPVETTKNLGPKLLKKYLQYTRAIADGDKTTAQEILYSLYDAGEHADKSAVQFDSPFEEEVYSRLIEKGYEVQTQYGVGGYRIDLVVFDPQTHQILLGVECDGKLYHSTQDARDRDFHRQRYLESRGWTIHRIWSTHWWNHPDQELAKLLTKLEARRQAK